jgi:tetratricopeptide (TPR) repeat protein
MLREAYMLSRTPHPFSLFPIIFFCLLGLFVTGASAASTISGGIFDKQRNPLPNIEVELLNDLYQSRQRTQTDGSGRYQFSGLPDGRYTVRVYAFRYDLQDQDMPVEIVTQNIRGGEGTGYFQQDFYLLPKKGGLAESEIGVVFAQDVPDAAKKAYERAVKDFASKRYVEGIFGLNESLEIFPNYYLALHRMGKELFLTKRYQEAVPFFLKAGEINPRSAATFYYLGYSLHKLGKEYNKAAVTSLSNALTLAPASMQVLYTLGIVERQEGKYPDAEKHLVQAKKLAKTPIPEIHKELAQLYADNLKRYDEAADELEAYLKAAKMEGAAAADTRKVIASLRAKARSRAQTTN